MIFEYRTILRCSRVYIYVPHDHNSQFYLFIHIYLNTVEQTVSKGEKQATYPQLQLWPFIATNVIFEVNKPELNDVSACVLVCTFSKRYGAFYFHFLCFSVFVSVIEICKSLFKMIIIVVIFSAHFVLYRHW